MVGVPDESNLIARTSGELDNRAVRHLFQRLLQTQQRNGTCFTSAPRGYDDRAGRFGSSAAQTTLHLQITWELAVANAPRSPSTV